MNGFLNQFPYSDFHEMNLDWIIKTVRKLNDEMNAFEAINKITYDPDDWSIAKNYAAWTLVWKPAEASGNAHFLYISIKPVPAGIMIDNEDYWALVTPFKVDFELDPTSQNPVSNSAVAGIESRLRDLLQIETNARVAADEALNTRLDNIESDLNAEETARAAADAEINQNVSQNTTDIATNFENIATLTDRVDNLSQTITPGGTTGDAELADIRVGANGITYATAGDAVRAQIRQVDNAINGYINGVNQTFTHTGTAAYDFFPCLLIKGVMYTITNNNTEHSMQSRIYKADNSYINVKLIDAGASYSFIVPDDGYVKVGGYMYNGASFTIRSEYSDVRSLNSDKTVDVIIGGITAGKPTTSAAYFRSKDFIRAHKGDMITLAPDTSVADGCVYFYSVPDVSGYTGSNVDIPTTASGASNSYAFTSDCFFLVRGKIGRNLTPSDIAKLSTYYSITKLVDPEMNETIETLGVNIDSINSDIAGNFNIAIQTDTHMADAVGYSSTEYLSSDFNRLKLAVNTINRLNVNLFAQLGDFVRGYAFDPDFQTRSTLDKMMEEYKRITADKAFVIGNHDDGNMYYSGTYNDKPSVADVLYPTEQFNRVTKFGLNNRGKSNYYYSDVNGVRIITLYQRDFDYAAAVPGIERFRIGPDQISWLQNTALNTDLPVIILTHAPLISDLYATSRVGFDDVLNVLNTFVTNGGTVIGCFSGHMHAQAYETVNNITHVTYANGYSWFELVSIDLENRSVSCKSINNTLADISYTY